MKKLSKAQQKVMDKAIKDINDARTMNFNEYYEKKCSIKTEEWVEVYRKYWENRRNGIVLTSCNSKTLAKLEEMGLIEIIEDSNGQSYGIDTIKILNY